MMLFIEAEFNLCPRRRQDCGGIPFEELD